MISNMKKILVLMTGGTIGSSLNDGIISVKKDSCRAVELYCRRFGNDVQFHTAGLLNILSENLDKQHWEIIVNYLRNTDLSGYSGVIITHGSDTLSYSSAMMSFCLCGLQLPVVLTAADLVPDAPGSNAVDDLRGAVTVIQNMLGGVYTVYKNPGDEYCSVYLASRITEADRVRGYFTSADGSPFALIRDDKMYFTGTASAQEAVERLHPIAFEGDLSLKNDVLMLRQYPGMDISCIRLCSSVRAVLVITYHSSSGCTEGRGSLLTLLAECRKRSAGLYLASFPENASLYETSDTLINNGAVPLRHISNEAAYAKLLLAVNLPITDISGFMEREVCLETIR